MDALELSQIPIFSDADDDELKKVGATAESVEFSENAEIIREGDFSTALLAIDEGTVEVTRRGEHIANLGPGDIFGEAGVVNDAVRNATVTTTSRLRLIIMGQLEVQRLKKNAPEIYARIERLAEERSG
jgi:CRP/FNR family cyclic AMP-dependent transcriptional regulator